MIQSIPLLVTKLTTILGRVQILLPLLLRHGSQIVKSMRHSPSPVLRQAPKLSRRAANLLPLLRRQPLHRLRPRDRLLPPLRSHIVQLCQPVPHVLLNLRPKLLEPRLSFQRSLLLIQRQIAMTDHPLAQVLPRVTDAGAVGMLDRSLHSLVVRRTDPWLRRVARRRDVMLLRLLCPGS